MLKKEAEEFLTSRGTKQKIAREAINSPAFQTEDAEGQGHPKAVRLAGLNNGVNRNTTPDGPPSNVGSSDGDFGQPHPERGTEIGIHETPYPRGPEAAGISVDAFLSAPLDRPETDTDPNDEEEVAL